MLITRQVVRRNDTQVVRSNDTQGISVFISNRYIKSVKFVELTPAAKQIDDFHEITHLDWDWDLKSLNTSLLSMTAAQILAITFSSHYHHHHVQQPITRHIDRCSTVVPKVDGQSGLDWMVSGWDEVQSTLRC